MDATGPPDARELAAFTEREGKLVDASSLTMRFAGRRDISMLCSIHR